MASWQKSATIGTSFALLGLLMMYFANYFSGVGLFAADLIYLLLANFASFFAYKVYYLGEKNNFFNLPKFENPFTPVVFIVMQGYGIYTVFNLDSESSLSLLPFLAGIVIVSGINCMIKPYVGSSLTSENSAKGKITILGACNVIFALIFYNFSLRPEGVDPYLGLIFASGAAAVIFFYYSAREWLNRVE